MTEYEGITPPEDVQQPEDFIPAADLAAALAESARHSMTSAEWVESKAKSWDHDYSDPRCWDAVGDIQQPKFVWRQIVDGEIRDWPRNPNADAGPWGDGYATTLMIMLSGEYVKFDEYNEDHIKCWWDNEASSPQSQQDDAVEGIVDEKSLLEHIEKWGLNGEKRLAAPVIQGLLFRGSIAAIYGPSHSGKTLATMAACACASQGVPFGDLGVRKTPVVYLNSESQGDFDKRMLALCKTWGVDDDTLPGWFPIHHAIDVRDVVEREHLFRMLPRFLGEGHRPPIFVFDTLAQHLSGIEGDAIDENSAKDMGRYIYGLREIAEKTGGIVLLVAHSGKDGERGIRGSSALRAALDTEIEVTGVKHQNKKLIKMRVTKQRFCDALDAACYEIHPVILDLPENELEPRIDDDDVMIEPGERTPEQFTRSVAPSNQSAVMHIEPMPVPSKANEDDVQPGKMSDGELTQAQHVRRIITDYFQGGQASRADIKEKWVDEGMLKSSLPKAIQGALDKGLIISLSGGILKTTVNTTVQGNIGNAADIAADKKRRDDNEKAVF